MLIGADFNNRAKQLLALLSNLSGDKPGKEISAGDLVAQLELDRTELKNLLGYLEDKELIEVVTIGGPFLYGHIRITEKGVLKAANLE